MISFLVSANPEEVPLLNITEVRSRIVKAKKPKGLVLGDLPRKLVQNCPDLLSFPATIIFNSISRSGYYPSAWKMEDQIAIPKSFPPESEDDLRNIAKTPFLSKVYESFVAQWLFTYIKPYLDPDQCGFKGSSISHYLIKFLHFIHSSLDLKKPHAVLAACFDLSKAFNRVDHSLVIQDLFDMHTPAWLLKIVCSYLTHRTMTLTYRGARSTSRNLPAGTPQGAFMGGLIFMIKFNGAFLRPPVPRPVPMLLQESKSVKVKYVDDGSVAVSINLETHLEIDTSNRPRPPSFHERTGHCLPTENNLLQYYVLDTENFTAQNNMVINKSKTDVIMFSNSRKYDFPPVVKFSELPWN